MGESLPTTPVPTESLRTEALLPSRRGSKLLGTALYPTPLLPRLRAVELVQNGALGPTEHDTGITKCTYVRCRADLLEPVGCYALFKPRAAFKP